MKTLLNTHDFAIVLWLRVTSKASSVFTTLLTLLLIAGSAAQLKAATFNSNSVTIGGSGVNGTYYTDLSGTPKFSTLPTLGTFDRGQGSLNFVGNSSTSSSGNEDVSKVELFYRVYSASATVTTNSPSYISATLGVVTASASGKDKTWKSSTPSSIDILSATNGPGNYIVEFYFQGTSTVKNTPSTFQETPFKTYKGTFTVTGSVPLTWTGNAGDASWNSAANWFPNGIPTSVTDVTIPAGLAVTKSYPLIRGGETDYARNLTIMGPTSLNANDGASISTVGGELRVYGNFSDPNAGFSASQGVFTLAGVNQTFDSDVFSSVSIEGGGDKTLSSNTLLGSTAGFMRIKRSLTFANNSGGRIITRTDNASRYGVALDNGVPITGETESSYVLGVLNSGYTFSTGNLTSNFGGIGISLTANSSPDGVTVTRYTGIAYTGTAIKTASVTRSFYFVPTNLPTSFSLVFNYLNVELNGNAAANLSFFSSPSTTNNFNSIGRTSVGPNVVALNNITTTTLFSTFTVAESAVPLPVTLVSFTATPTAQGAALLRWVTATESDNRGFGIERQLGANEAWQSVSFVAAKATTGSTYEFADKSLTSAPASTQAYYRLRQEDLDGKVTYSPVAVINRTAAVAASQLTLSPVPVSGSDNLSVGLAEAGQAGILVAVTNTQGQRMMNFTTQASTDAALTLPVSGLAAGVYIVTVQVPGQAVRHARFVKL